MIGTINNIRTPITNMVTIILFFVSLYSFGHAFEGKCFLEIDEHIYLSENCNIELQNQSFSIGTGDEARSRYFAFVNIGPDRIARGYWNGAAGENHAHEELGTLVRDGACWVNNRAKVCAWR
jgi:hypothetical protein